MWRREALVALAAASALWSGALPAGADAADRRCADEVVLGGTFRDVTVAPGTWCLFGNAVVTGSFRAEGASSVGIFFGTRIDGDVTLTGTSSFPDATGQAFGGTANAICTSTIGGNLTIEGSGPQAPWNVGSSTYPPYANFSNCVYGNTIRGSVRFVGNAAPAHAVGGNRIGRDLECDRNGGWAAGFPAPTPANTVTGARRGDCGFGAPSPAAPPSVEANPPAAADCRSRRRIVIRLDRRLVSATVTVRSTSGTRRARIVRARRLRAIIDLRGLPAQRVAVRITGVTRGGRTRRFSRSFASCDGRRPTSRPVA